MKRRGSGILLSITSLPSPYGIGDMAHGAHQFLDFLAETKQSFWQVLPLSPIDAACGYSPYAVVSSFAGNPLLISPELMLQDGFLDKGEVEPVPNFPQDRVDYPSVIAYKDKLFYQAYQHFKQRKNDYDYQRFCSRNSSWLDDFALFMALKSHFQGKEWSQWPQAVRDRDPESLQSLKYQLQDRVEQERFLQYVFFSQWHSFKSYCNDKGIQIIGDMPIYVGAECADVWTNPHLFNLNEEKKPSLAAGVPPDYFSKTGQLWGNPTYRWAVLKENGYRWWIQRVAQNLSLFDVIRIDHFRGFVSYWAVKAGEKTAIEGSWYKVPTEDFFTTLLKHFPYLPIIAEDLGIITADVREVMHRFEFPGMKVLLFAFGENLPTHPYLPHNYGQNCVVYTGTHDNNTIRGWFDHEATEEDKRRLFRYLGREVPAHELHWEFIRLAMSSVATMVIIPLQDILGLGEEARMNRPATIVGNWQWRLSADQLSPSQRKNLLEMTEVYGRA